ncbi:DUF3397 domain-containing protein [Carnobacterium gallinarum]|uniref:DUF3397 domain-containing protein n=1 Tax=Carnobacterium gallinarum TaxID=2749 RepID=UPI001FDEB860|nr:DUF3397 domain-containing protein [Carnobacterium gallinarum]
MIVEELIFAILPIVLLWLIPKFLHKRLVIQGVIIKAPDLMVPFLFVGIHVLSMIFFKQSWLPYFAIFILSFGIIVVCLMAYKQGEILFSRFFRLFWRFSFVFSFLIYYLIIILNGVSFFI